MTTCIRKVASKKFGVTRVSRSEVKDTWWRNDNVQKLIKEKKDCFTHVNLDNSIDNVEKYKVAKKTAKANCEQSNGSGV